MRSTISSKRPQKEQVTDPRDLRHGDMVEIWTNSPKPKKIIKGHVEGSAWSSTENPKDIDMVRVSGRSSTAKLIEDDYFFKNFLFYYA